MYYIRQNAEISVRNLLKDVAKRAGSNILSAVDYLDDGSPVRKAPLFIPKLSVEKHPRLHLRLKLTRLRAPLYWTSKAQAVKSAGISTHLFRLYIRQ